jgi:hypothetical protein
MTTVPGFPRGGPAQGVSGKRVGAGTKHESYPKLVNKNLVSKQKKKKKNMATIELPLSSPHPPWSDTQR